MTQLKKVNLFTDGFKQKLIDTEIGIFKCSKCSYEAGFFGVLNNSDLIFKNVKQHIKKHLKELPN